MDKIFLAPRSMHKSLLLISRKEDIFANPKILTKEEFLDKYYGKISPEGAYVLFCGGDILYDNLEEILPIIPRTNNNCFSDKNNELYELKEQLKQANLIEYDEFFPQFIKGKEIEIYGYSEDDTELTTLLDLIHISYEFKEFSHKENTLEIKKFALLEEEIYWMLNEIADLITNGVRQDDIYIYVTNETAIRYMKRYIDSFGLTANFPNNQSLYSQELVSAFLMSAKISENFDQAFEMLENLNVELDDNILNALHELCHIDLPFNKKYDYVSSVLKRRMIQNARYENAINIIDSPIIDENKHIYIPCFAQNEFPKSYKDSSFVSDADKEELGILTSLERCRIEDKICRNFLSSNNVFHLSRSGASFAEKFFPSPFANLLNIPEIVYNDIPNKIYSKKYAEYRLGTDLDKKLYFLQDSKYIKPLESLLDIQYRKYDNQYTNADAVSLTEKIQLSYSSIDKFYNCPFAYYLNYVLKISSFEDNFYTKLGKVAHEVFQHQYENGFDFDTTFDEASKKQEWLDDDKLLLEGLKADIKKASDACVLHYKSFAINSEVKTECKLIYQLDKNTSIVGYVDKIMLLDGKDAIIVDYKTNGTSFERSKLEDGISMQLPTYAILFSNTPEYSNYNVTGLYINNVINSGFTCEKSEDEIIDSYLKLNGITLGTIDAASKIDQSILNSSRKSFFIKGVALKAKTDEFKSTKSIFIGNELEEMKAIVLNKYLEAIKKIRNNEFPIYPMAYSGDSPCKYCEYRDICFVRNKQKHTKDKNESEDE